MYDAVIIGGGAVGCAVARWLSRYRLRICLLERGEDVCTGTSKANSAICHAGFDAPVGSAKARFNVEGSRMMEALSRQLDFPYRRCGALVLCFNETDIPRLEELKARGECNGVEGLAVLDREALRRQEPRVAPEAVAALYAPTSAIICPFGMTIALAENRASQLAAVISSNAGGPSRLSGGDAIPAGLVVGEGNYADRGIPGYTADTSYPEDDTSVLVRSTEAAAAGADIYWDAAKNLKGATNHNMNDWIAYFTDANGLGEDSLSDVIVYSGGNALNGGHDDAQGSLSDWESNNARYRTWKWYNEDDIPVMTYIFSLYEAHNCIPGFRPLMWDFLEHYSVETAADGTVTRYYSASGFEQDDAVVIQ